MTWFNKYSYYQRKDTGAKASSPATPTTSNHMYDRNNQYNSREQKNIVELPAGSILLYNITPEEFFSTIKGFVKEALQQDQLLTKQGAMKMSGVSAAKFKRAIEEGIVKPQLIKGRTTAMYLESEVVKIGKKTPTT